MSRQTYEYNLVKAEFPFTAGGLGGTSLLRNGDTATNDKGSANVPQIYYVENFLPTDKGWQGVLPEKQIDPVDGLNIDAHLQLLVEGGGVAYIMIQKSLLPAVWVLAGDTWIEKAIPDFVSINTVLPFNITQATMRGITYFCIPFVGVYYYDSASQSVKQVELQGLSMSSVMGIVAGVNYLVAYDETTIYYSAPGNEFNFTPTPIGAGGSARIIQAKGKFIACYAIQDGFIIYTAANAVAAIYNSNAAFPFTYKEIANSSGIPSASHVAWEASSGQHFVFTSSCIMVVTKTKAELVFPEVYDFLTRDTRQAFRVDSSLATFPITSNAFTLDAVKLSFLGSRYLSISYKDDFQDTDIKDSVLADGPFTAALIYDLAQQKWGRLKVAHYKLSSYLPASEVIALRYVDLIGTYEDQTLRYLDYTRTTQEVNAGDEAVAIHCSNGKLHRLSTYYDLGEYDQLRYLPKLLQGRMAVVKNKTLVLHEVLAQGHVANLGIHCVLPTNLYKLDGVLLELTPTDEGDDSNARYCTRVTGHNLSILYSGFINLASSYIVTANGGSR